MEGRDNEEVNAILPKKGKREECFSRTVTSSVADCHNQSCVTRCDGDKKGNKLVIKTQKRVYLDWENFYAITAPEDRRK